MSLNPVFIIATQNIFYHSSDCRNAVKTRLILNFVDWWVKEYHGR